MQKAQGQLVQQIRVETDGRMEVIVLPLVLTRSVTTMEGQTDGLAVAGYSCLLSSARGITS